MELKENEDDDEFGFELEEEEEEEEEEEDGSESVGEGGQSGREDCTAFELDDDDKEDKVKS